MKKCKMCGKSDSDNVLFCAGCGGREFVFDTSQNAQFNFTPCEIKGKVKAWQIIAIALACIAIIAGGYFAVTNVLNTKTYTDGEISNNVYSNDWAELQFAFENGFIDVTAEEGFAFESADSDVGFVAYRGSDGALMSLSFYNLGNRSGYSERDGLNDYLDGYVEEIKSGFGVDATVSQYFKHTIAGKEYTTAKVDIPTIGTDYYCIRFEGNYAIIIAIVEECEEDAIAALSLIQYYEGE